MNDKGLRKSLDILIKNTDRVEKTIKNTDTLDVLLAMTRLCQEENKAYLDLYNKWLEGANVMLEDNDVVENNNEIN